MFLRKQVQIGTHQRCVYIMSLLLLSYKASSLLHCYLYASGSVSVCLNRLCNHRFSRIQEEAGIKAKRQKGAKSDPDAAAVAAEAAAKSGGGLANLLDELLEGDFDPDAYDKRMAAAFDDEYYEVCVCVCESRLGQRHVPLMCSVLSVVGAPMNWTQ